MAKEANAKKSRRFANRIACWKTRRADFMTARQRLLLGLSILFLIGFCSTRVESLSQRTKSVARRDQKEEPLPHWRYGLHTASLGKGDWRLWVNDLIDWCFSRGSQEAQYSLLPHQDLYAYSSEVQAVQETFTGVLLPTRRNGIGKPPTPYPYASAQAREEFLHRLRTVGRPLLPDYDISWAPQQAILGKSLNLTLKEWKQWSKQNDFPFPLDKSKAKSKIVDWQKEAMTKVGQLEGFAAKYPQDRYLGGYARLYAAILRMHWSLAIDPTATLLDSIERDYQDFPSIAIMAAWYKAILLAYYERNEAKAAFLSVAQKYSKHDWWVVSAARRAAKGGNYDGANIYLFAPPQDRPWRKGKRS